MLTVRFRHLGIAALALSLLPLSALAQGLPTGKRQHEPVSIQPKNAADPDRQGRVKVKFPWLETESLEPAGASDRAHELDPEAGEVRFGDGVRGRRLPSGEPGASQPGGSPPQQKAKLPPLPSAGEGRPLGSSGSDAPVSQHNQSDMEFLRQRASKGGEGAGTSPVGLRATPGARLKDPGRAGTSPLPQPAPGTSEK
jgi:hypothetical protein